MREWLQPMGLRGAIRASNVPIYQELARHLGLERMGEPEEVQRSDMALHAHH